MLQRAEAESGVLQPRWVTMSCADPDDYEGLQALGARWGNVNVGDAVVLLRGDEMDCGPMGDDWFLRHGRVKGCGGELARQGKLAIEIFAHARWGGQLDDVNLKHCMREGQPMWKVFLRTRRGQRRGKTRGLKVRTSRGVQFQMPTQLQKSAARLRCDIGARAKRIWAATLRLRMARQRRESKKKDAMLDALGAEIWRLKELNVEKERKRKQAEQKARDAPLRDFLRVVPIADIPLRVSKFDVVLREAPLRAVHAMQTILSRMVLFRCMVCNERFPTFHPAYVPPKKLDLHMLRRGANGAAHCNMEVAAWNEMPPLEHDGDEMAKRYTGTCLACEKDMERQRRHGNAEGEEVAVAPKRSFLNNMDPNWNFPRYRMIGGMTLEWLFQQATVTEACLVALDFMQVNFCTVRKSMMHVFKKNTISFPQETVSFFSRRGVLKEFRVNDRVNSSRGPFGDAKDPERPPRQWRDASEAEQQRFGKDPEGRVFLRRLFGRCLTMGICS